MVDLFDDTQLWTLQQRLKHLSIDKLWLSTMMRDALATPNNQAQWVSMMHSVGLDEMARDLESIDLGTRTYFTSNDVVGLFQQREIGAWDSGIEVVPASMRRGDSPDVCSSAMSMSPIIDRFARNLKDRQ